MNRLSRLILDAEGFVFDPTSGESFTVNPTGLFILNSIRDHKSLEAIALELQEEFGVTVDNAEKDVLDFKTHLRTYSLLTGQEK